MDTGMVQSSPPEESTKEDAVKVLSILSGKLEKIVNDIGGVVLAGGWLFAVVVILMRVFFKSGILLGFNIAAWIMVAGILLLLGPTLKNGRHIALDAFVCRLKGRTRLAVNLIVNLVGVGFSTCLVVWGIKFVMISYKLKSPFPGFDESVIWPYHILFPLSATLLLFFYFEDLFRSFLSLMKKRGD